jgi:hypothetical protein
MSRSLPPRAGARLSPILSVVRFLWLIVYARGPASSHLCWGAAPACARRPAHHGRQGENWREAGDHGLAMLPLCLSRCAALHCVLVRMQRPNPCRPVASTRQQTPWSSWQMLLPRQRGPQKGRPASCGGCGGSCGGAPGAPRGARGDGSRAQAAAEETQKRCKDLLNKETVPDGRFFKWAEGSAHVPQLV